MLLLESGADPVIYNIFGANASHMAARSGQRCADDPGFAARLEASGGGRAHETIRILERAVSLQRRVPRRPDRLNQESEAHAERERWYPYEWIDRGGGAFTNDLPRS